MLFPVEALVVYLSAKVNRYKTCCTGVLYTGVHVFLDAVSPTIGIGILLTRAKPRTTSPFAE